MNREELTELPYQALETERGGVQVYRTALRCVVNEKLKEEWQEYLEQTENHVRVVEKLFGKMSLDPEAETPGRLVVRHIGQSLVKAMELALGAGKPEAAQLVAAECVIHAETKKLVARAPGSTSPFKVPNSLPVGPRYRPELLGY